MISNSLTNSTSNNSSEVQKEYLGDVGYKNMLYVDRYDIEDTILLSFQVITSPPVPNTYLVSSNTVELGEFLQSIMYDKITYQINIVTEYYYDGNTNSIDRLHILVDVRYDEESDEFYFNVVSSRCPTIQVFRYYNSK